MAFMLGLSNQMRIDRVKRKLRRGGLHRELQTTISIVTEEIKELKCALAIRENITRDTYVMLEEMEAVQSLEFYPHEPIDIERPSSASESHEVLLRVNVTLPPERIKGFVKSY